MGRPTTPRERVREFWRARLAGLSLPVAAARGGVSKQTASRGVINSGGGIPDLTEPTRRYLCVAEREDIAAYWAEGLSKAEIARRLGRHRSPIGRELARYAHIRPSDHRPRQHRPGTR